MNDDKERVERKCSCHILQFQYFTCMPKLVLID